MSTTVTMAWEILDRMERAVAKVRDRLLRATAALNQAAPRSNTEGNFNAAQIAACAPWSTGSTRSSPRTTPPHMSVT